MKPLESGSQVYSGIEEDAMEVRKARLSDIPALAKLINGYARQGIMLPRTELELAENIRDFAVAVQDGLLIACGALHIYSPVAAEIRSLAVLPEYKGCGAGRATVTALEEEAAGFGLLALFAFTYVEAFFRRLGYREVDRGELPLKAWKDCLRCPKFSACDEIAMLKLLDEPAYRAYLADECTVSAAQVGIVSPELVPLPKVRN